MFGRTKPREPSVNQPRINDPMAVIPLQPEKVEQRRDSLGHIHLRLTIERTGLLKKVGGWLKYDNTKTVELDDYGTFYYSQIDGKTTLETIISRMVEHFQGDRTELAGRVILFTKKLMIMNMLVLMVPESAQYKET